MRATARGTAAVDEARRFAIEHGWTRLLGEPSMTDPRQRLEQLHDALWPPA